MIQSGQLLTRDHVPIAYDHVREGRDEIVIVCPGFFNSKKNRWMQRARDIVGKNFDTLIFDFRGHGESGGKFTWSAREHWDLEAILDFALNRGYQKIGILAFSLGAAATINLLPHRPEIQRAVLVSCPASFWGVEYHFWRPEMLSDLKDNIECDWEGKGARTGFIFLPKPKPLYNVKKIQDAPLLFIHGERDWIIHDRHSRQLFAAAATQNKRLEIIPGGLHAERLIQQFPEQMEQLICHWFNPG